MDIITPNQAEDIVRDIVSNLLLNQFNAESTFMRNFTQCPRGIPQIAHHALYAKNLIGHIIGLDSPLTFDHHTGLLTKTVLLKNVKDVLEIFYQNFTPEKIITGLQCEINRRLKLMSDEQASKFAQGLWQACGDDYFEWNDDISRVLKISESGCETLLVNMGYLVKSKRGKGSKRGIRTKSKGLSTKKIKIATN